MLTLLIYVGSYIFAVDTKYVRKIIPRVKSVKIPHVPDYILGHINFEGTPVLTADLSVLVDYRPSNISMHSRILLLQPDSQPDVSFGLLAEKVTDICEMQRASFINSGVYPNNLPFFDGIVNKEEVAIQLINVDKLYSFLIQD